VTTDGNRNLQATPHTPTAPFLPTYPTLLGL
jgi:hypothetical protein